MESHEHLSQSKALVLGHVTEAFAFPELCCGGAFSSATAATRLQFDLRTSFRGTLWRATKPHILISNLMPPAFCARVVSQPDARSSSRLASCVSFQSRARAAALLQVGCCFCGGSAMGPFGSWLRVSREPKTRDQVAESIGLEPRCTS